MSFKYIPDGQFSLRFSFINIIGHDISGKTKIRNFATLKKNITELSEIILNENYLVIIIPGQSFQLKHF